ncbi:hypothetical protein IWX90DRAFT_511649 [Phyllosticta citrichinensis]|uniref:Uncharacterized protein n=1 Tax=Phyllosticta citrichinensis TaxID=1130410 RepID=A0ABR1Y4J1_9PEZI
MDVETYESYEKSWLQVRDMSVLTLRDHLEVQYHLPLLLIRLGKESDLCKYLKWYETKPYQNYRHFENLEDKTADIFEPVDVLCEAITDPYNLQCPDLYNMFCVMLLKAKILLDLQKPSILHHPSQLEWLINNIDAQIKQLFHAIDETWPWIWNAFLSPEQHLRTNIID